MAKAVALATGRAVDVCIAPAGIISASLDRLSPGADAGTAGAEAAESASASFSDDAERLRDMASESPVIRLVNAIITRAAETRATDIHLEPAESGLRVRYRHDGMLEDVEPPPPHLATALVSRIKIMAQLDIAERRLPQDGRIKLCRKGREIDLRVSTVPTLHGETVALRLLNRRRSRSISTPWGSRDQ